MRLSFALLVCAPALLPACSSGPRVAPALKATLERIFETSKADVHENPGKPLPWAVGQWVLTRSTPSRGERSATRAQIVKQEGRGLWIEYEQTTAREQRHIAMLVENHDPGKGEALRIRKVLMDNQGDGKILEIDDTNPVAGVMNSELEAQLARLRSIDFTPGDVDVAAGAGNFKNTRPQEVEFEAGMAPMKIRGTAKIWVTGAVPINFAARTESTSQITFGGTVTSVDEVVDFGLSGARSHFFPGSPSE